MIELSDVLIVGLLAAAALLWWRAQGCRELALRATRAHCKNLQIQLLDDTVALQRFWFRRDNGGRWRYWALYEFEFTNTGDDRYRGSVTMLGPQLLNIYLEPHRFLH